MNVDGYKLNLKQREPRGCRRSNLRNTCSQDYINNTKTTTNRANEGDKDEDDKYKYKEDAGDNEEETGDVDPTIVPPCPELNHGGIDLNRNFPTDWEGDDLKKCSYDYPGPHPLSEPESQTIAAVVEHYNITHAISIHSRRDDSPRSTPLLIHPYVSTRSFQTMNAKEAKRFRTRSLLLNQNVGGVYTTGTAGEAIKYTASGSTIDWLYGEKDIPAFVIEAIPPCASRWCRGMDVFQNAEPHATTMKHFVSLVVNEVEKHSNTGMHLSAYLSFSFSFIIVVILLIKRKNHRCRLFLHRFVRTKEEQEEKRGEQEQVEMLQYFARQK